MPDEVSAASDRAAAATTQEIGLLIHDADEDTLQALLETPNLDESNVIQLLERLDLSAKVLAAIADAEKWNANESVIFAWLAIRIRHDALLSRSFANCFSSIL